MRLLRLLRLLDLLLLLLPRLSQWRCGPPAAATDRPAGEHDDGWGERGGAGAL